MKLAVLESARCRFSIEVLHTCLRDSANRESVLCVYVICVYMLFYLFVLLAAW